MQLSSSSHVFDISQNVIIEILYQALCGLPWWAMESYSSASFFSVSWRRRCTITAKLAGNIFGLALYLCVCFLARQHESVLQAQVFCSSWSQWVWGFHKEAISLILLCRTGRCSSACLQRKLSCVHFLSDISCFSIDCLRCTSSLWK